MRLLEASETDGGSIVDAARSGQSVGELVRPAAPSPAGPITGEEPERLPQHRNVTMIPTREGRVRLRRRRG